MHKLCSKRLKNRPVSRHWNRSQNKPAAIKLNISINRNSESGRSILPLMPGNPGIEQPHCLHYHRPKKSNVPGHFLSLDAASGYLFFQNRLHSGQTRPASSGASINISKMGPRRWSCVIFWAGRSILCNLFIGGSSVDDGIACRTFGCWVTCLSQRHYWKPTPHPRTVLLHF